MKLINDEGEIEINLYSGIVILLICVAGFVILSTLSNSNNSVSEFFNFLGVALFFYLVYLFIKWIKKRRK